MPLALVIGDAVRPLDQVALALRGLGRWAEAERVILERARSLYLLRWFGNALPLSGRALRVRLANADAIAEQLQRMRTGPRPLAPAMGAAGIVTGFLANPLYAGILAYGYGRRGGFLGALRGILYGLGGGIAGPMLAAALLALSAIAAVLSPALPVVQTGASATLSGAGRMLELVRELWAQLSGRRPVANPVVRAALELLTSMSRLLPQAMALIAALITRIAPALPTLATQLTATIRFSAHAAGVAAGAAADLEARLRTFFRTDGQRGDPLWLAEHAIDQLTAGLAAVRRWLAGVADILSPPAGARSIIADNPVVVLLRNLGDLKPHLHALAMFLWGAGKAMADPIIALFDRTITVPAPGTAYPTAAPAAPTPPAAPERSVPYPWAGLVARMGRLDAPPTGTANPLDPTGEVQAALRRASRRGSLFERRLADLRRAGADQAIADRAALDHLDAYRAVIGRLLPAAAARALPRLDATLRAIEDALSGRPGRRPELPVRDLPERVLLRPEIDTLRVSVPAPDEAGAETWAGRMRDALSAEPIIVVTAG